MIEELTEEPVCPDITSGSADRQDMIEHMKKDHWEGTSLVFGMGDIKDDQGKTNHYGDKEIE